MCTVTRMRDGEIRAALHARLIVEHQGEPDTRFLDELSLCGLVRVDVAVINGTLAGYELKSDLDTLRRLPAHVTVQPTSRCTSLMRGGQTLLRLRAKLPGPLQKLPHDRHLGVRFELRPQVVDSLDTAS